MRIEKKNRRIGQSLLLLVSDLFGHCINSHILFHKENVNIITLSYNFTNLKFFNFHLMKQ